MGKYIDKDALVAEMERRIKEYQSTGDDYWFPVIENLKSILSLLNTLEVKEIKLPNPRFPHLNNIVDKVFGTGNLESLKYEEAEQLVLLAKEELLKDLEVKEVDLGTDFGICWGKYCDCGGNINYYEVAKHFFELGLKVSNHLTWKDIAHINDIISEILKECKDKILYDTQESFCKEVLKRFKVQKGEEV